MKAKYRVVKTANGRYTAYRRIWCGLWLHEFEGQQFVQEFECVERVRWISKQRTQTEEIVSEYNRRGERLPDVAPLLPK